jgi:outer membrane protein assembly factor BamB
MKSGKQSLGKAIGLWFGVATLCAMAADWPQWRGANRDGISSEKGLLKEWPAEGPKLLWKVTDIGSGYSTPSVADRKSVV